MKRSAHEHEANITVDWTMDMGCRCTCQTSDVRKQPHLPNENDGLLLALTVISLHFVFDIRSMMERAKI